jgi:hypothetical protein
VNDLERKDQLGKHGVDLMASAPFWIFSKSAALPLKPLLPRVAFTNL